MATVWWRLPVLGHHILVAGATGAGKGSILWSLIAGLAPGISAGWIRVLVIDPKGGMEFGPKSYSSSFAYDNGGDNTLALLRGATIAVALINIPAIPGQMIPVPRPLDDPAHSNIPAFLKTECRVQDEPACRRHR